MRENSVQAVRTRKTRRYHRHTPAMGFAPNLLNQGFMATAANQKWSVDISYIETYKGWLYRAVVIDLCSRNVVG